jgi:MFS family permease
MTVQAQRGRERMMDHLAAKTPLEEAHVQHSPGEWGIGNARRYYTLLVLTLVLLLGMVDRFALAPLVEPVKADLGVSDAQMSLLIGASFALFYTIIGLFAGHLVDRFNRRNLILGGLVIWTTMTFCSAFAPSYGWLFLFRSGVGVGEAVLSPAIYSILRDIFPSDRRSLAFGINNLGSPLGNALGLFAIGHLSSAAAAGALLGLPVLGGLAPWRIVLGLIGLSGLPFALLLLTLREPDRPAVTKDRDSDEGSVAAVWAHFRREQRAYLLLFASTALFGTGFYGLTAWMPSALVRAWGWPIGAVAPRLGLLQAIMAPIGLVMAGLVLARAGRAEPAVAARRVATAGGVAMLLASIGTAAWAAMPGAAAAWVAIAVVLALTPWSGITVMTLVAQITLPRMMGKISAVNFLMLSIVGMVFGPWVNPALGIALFAGPRALLWGIGLGSGLAFGLAGLCAMLALPLGGKRA